MLYAGHAVTKQQNRSHSHSDHEIVICVSGSGQQQIYGRALGFKKGAIFFLPEFSTHYVTGFRKEAAELIYLCFDKQYFSRHNLNPLQNIVDFWLAHRRYSFEQSDDDYLQNRRLAKRLLREIRGARAFRETIFHSCLCDVIIRLQRSIGENEDNRHPHFKRIQEFCDELQDGRHEGLSLVAAARYLGMSRALFARVFKQITGQSYVNYLMSFRIENARELLTNSRKTVSEIAFQSGFNHLGHFHKAFRNSLNMTPRQYRVWSHNQENPRHLNFENSDSLTNT